MLLIDGIRYQEWEISNEDELEQMVIEHAKDIFGENSIYFDKKQKLKSLAGVGSIPDGLVIMFGSAPQWHIVEVELSSHDPYDHVVPQVDKFINGIDNPNTRNKLVDTLYNLINSDELLRRETRQAIGLDRDFHKFLADLISQPPTITIIIEKDTDQLKEALRKYAQKKVIEFQTFTREGVGLAVHAHLFEPLHVTTSLATMRHISDETSTFFRPSPPRVEKKGRGFPPTWGKAEYEGKEYPSARKLATTLGLQIEGMRDMIDVFENPRQANTKIELPKIWKVEAERGKYFRVIRRER